MSQQNIVPGVRSGLSFHDTYHGVPIGPLATPEKLQATVGDDIENDVFPNFNGQPEWRGNFVAEMQAQRWQWDGVRGQARRERLLGAGGYPVESGDRVPVVLMNHESAASRRIIHAMGDKNAHALRRSVINRDDMNQ